MKNTTGEYLTGYVLADKYLSSNNPELVEYLARNNRKIISNRDMSTKTLTTEVYSMSDYSIGNSWKLIDSWAQYHIETKYGTYSEWKGQFYLKNSPDNKDYYAMAIKGEMSPNGGVCFSRKLRYVSDADSNGQSNKLFEHQPITEPSNYNWSFSLGGSLSKDSSANIGISWGGTFSDLKFIDNSKSVNQLMDITFDYNEGWVQIPDYLQNTSYQNTAFIYQTSASNSYCLMDNDRYVTFGYLYDVVYDTGSLNYATKVWK